MKHYTKYITMMIAAFIVVQLFSATSLAARLDGTAFDLIDPASGYQVIVPGFIKHDEVTVEHNDGKKKKLNVVVVEAPEKNKDGTYSLFEVVTKSKKAYRLKSQPKGYYNGDLGLVTTKISNGSAIYSVPALNSSNLKKIAGEDIYIFNFQVFDEQNKSVFAVYDLLFMFQNSDGMAKPTSSPVFVNNEEVMLMSYLIGDHNYVKLRDVAAALTGTEKQFNIAVDSSNRTIKLLPGENYTSIGSELQQTAGREPKDAVPSKFKIETNGKLKELSVYTIDSSSYFKLQDLQKLIGFQLDWDAATKTIEINAAPLAVQIEDRGDTYGQPTATTIWKKH
ncbi:hypothetical protein ACFSTH_18985 [Paenibacillus yanchengensis]|uniref:Copper amine oxidase-like N-terminal domain-containing protein n=1 Tax=Paenibacillus yanchengensis TaxID=2035833 RepID=A0ABW4YLR9_9BACL